MDFKLKPLSVSSSASWLRRSLGHPWLPLVLAAAAMLSMLPALSLGWVWDDLVHRAWLLPASRLEETIKEAGLIPPASGELATVLMNLYSFVGSTRSAEDLMDLGLLPWWTSSEVSLSHWRPVTALSHWLDYQLWPDSAALMHLHSILWYGSVVLVVAFAYRRLLRPVWVAGLSALLFAIDESHYIPVAWIASRNILLSMFFGILTLLTYDRWRRRGKARAGLTAAGLFSVALLTGEAGVSTVAYLGAYAVFLDQGRWTERLGRLSPFLGLTVVWGLVYHSLGYGGYGTGLYTNPIRESLRFAAGALERTPILLLGQWAWPPAQVYSYLSEPMQRLLWLLAIAFIGYVLAMLLPLLVRDRVAAFFATAMLLSLIPPSGAGTPHERRLFFVGFGAMGLAGQFIGGVARSHPWVRGSGLWRLSAAALSSLLLVMHLGLAGSGRLLAPRLTSLGNGLAEATLRIEAGAELRDQDLVIVNAPSSFPLLFFPFLRADQGAPLPRHMRVLAPSFVPLEITRTGENALSIRTQAVSLLPTEPPSGTFQPHPVFRLLRAEEAFHAQNFDTESLHDLALPGVDIHILEVGPDGHPRAVSYEFPVPLEDPSLRWVTWDWQTWSYRSFRPPPLGEHFRVGGGFDRPPTGVSRSISRALLRDDP